MGKEVVIKVHRVSLGGKSNEHCDYGRNWLCR